MENEEMVKKEKIMKEEAKNLFEDEGIDSKGSSEVSSTESSDDENEFDWMKEKEDSKGIFFVMSTHHHI